MKKNIFTSFLSKIGFILLAFVFVFIMFIIEEMSFDYIFKRETKKEKIRYALYFLCELLSAVILLIGLAIFFNNTEQPLILAYCATAFVLIFPCLLFWAFEKHEKNLKEKEKGKNKN